MTFAPHEFWLRLCGKRVPGKEGRRSLAFLRQPAEVIHINPRQTKKDETKKKQPQCLAKRGAAPLRYREGGQDFPAGPRCCGQVRTAGATRVGKSDRLASGSLYAEHVCARLFVTHWMVRDHTVLLVCGISRLKIAATVGGEKKKGRDSACGGVGCNYYHHNPTFCPPLNHRGNNLQH